MLTPRRILALALLLGVLSPLAASRSGGSILIHMGVHLALVAAIPALLAPRLPVHVGAGLLLAAAGLELLAVWGWHLPGPHMWARVSTGGWLLEKASFLAAGLAVWAVAAGAGALGGVAVLLFTSMHMTLLGAILTLAPRDLYGGLCAGWFGLTALQEQQLAGAAMAGIGGAIYLVAALARLGPTLRRAAV
ncbi:cytochrome c oxidase assembly protein [Paracoccus sp. Z118]|uniref:cytochrome c oxidase assembly protein n=1 Tax=Paracoccus sp. Z118 TaxID=2851017 RepID=UPI001C2B7A6F|nr:cytochrome c oxidase assembly protein [Paracoccus sp. Z118]MBV0892304.1 cytochrome c oxidase assembly protein [Paracoccus sp. Z118]